MSEIVWNRETKYNYTVEHYEKMIEGCFIERTGTWFEDDELTELVEGICKELVETNNMEENEGGNDFQQIMEKVNNAKRELINIISSGRQVSQNVFYNILQFFTGIREASPTPRSNRVRNRVRNSRVSPVVVPSVSFQTANGTTISMDNIFNDDYYERLRNYMRRNNHNLLDVNITEIAQEMAISMLEESIIETVTNESFDEANQLERDGKKNIKFETCKEYNPEDNCQICFDDFGKKQKIVDIGCDHNFHKKCIVEWGHYKNNCPICRHDIPLKRKYFRVKKKPTEDTTTPN
jgi:hypothetical protein